MARDPGLWFSSLSIRIEVLRKVHKRECSDCHKDPLTVGDRRLVVKRGHGRREEIAIYCVTCGRGFLHRMGIEAENAKQHLATGEGSVRCL
jgi:RNase P subunit RPR2